MVQGGESYHDRECTSSEAEKDEVFHPFQKNKKVEEAAKLAGEKHTKMLVAGVWKRKGIQIAAEDKDLEDGTTHLH